MSNTISTSSCPSLNILSSNKNNTGYSLIIEFSKHDKPVFQSGVSFFKIQESISNISEISFSMNLTQIEFNELCSKLNSTESNINLETLSPFFYFKNIHAYLVDSKFNKIREFNGFISSTYTSNYASSATEYISIQFTAHPIPWFMQKTNAYRAYVNKTVKEIISDVFKNFCIESYLTIEYIPEIVVYPRKKTNRINCVQNGESHWDFILRLLDEEDWNYTFIHKEKKCDIYIFDNIDTPSMIIPSGYQHKVSLELLDDYGHINFINTSEKSSQPEYLTNLKFSNNGSVSPVEVFDSDYRAHGTILHSSETTPLPSSTRPNPVKLKWTSGFEGGKKYYENHDININSHEKAKGIEVKKSSECHTAEALTNSSKIFLGSIISANYNKNTKKINSSPLKSINNYRVHQLVFTFTSSSTSMSNRCTICTTIRMHQMESDFIVEQNYTRNFIDGTRQGKVIADNSQIYLDSRYYIKIALPWQYENENTSLFSKFIYARYMTPWAGQNYGIFATPRHDDEVLVAFEDGDPDLPVVLGSMYNSKRQFPVDIKLKKHVLAIYDQPSDNQKNNFLEMDSKTGTVNLASAENMKIRSYGEHLTQSKMSMTLKSAKDINISSKNNTDLTSAQNVFVNAEEEIVLHANKKITFKVGSSLLSIDETGEIKLNGKNISLLSANNYFNID